MKRAGGRTVRQIKGGWKRIPPKGRIAIVLVMVVILIAMSLNMSGVSFSEEEYHLIPFDADRSYRDLLYLTSLGPRHSGTESEHKGAEYIADQWEVAGLSNVHIETFEVFLFEIDSASLSMVEYGPGGVVPLPFNTRIVEYVHKVDFVVQGFSGSNDWVTFRDDLEMVDIGNGTDEGAWAQATGKAGVLRTVDGGPNNTEAFRLARDNNLRTLILLNEHIHEKLNYPPIFKGTYFGEGEEYPDIPFFMVSRDVGNEMMAGAANGSKLRVDMFVTRELRDIKVVIGDVPGREKSAKYVLIGGHHDTVYNGIGAVDNTSGTVTVLELGRTMAKERPKHTIRFVTWGGEEEGLFGSGEYVKAHEDDILKNCIFYENLDMPNIDVSRGFTGWIGTNDNSTIDRYNEILDKVVESNSRFERYDISVNYHHLIMGSDQAHFAKMGIKCSFGAGSGSWEYHTYMDDLTHVNPESQELFGMVIGTHAYQLAEKA